MPATLAVAFYDTPLGPFRLRYSAEGIEGAVVLYGQERVTLPIEAQDYADVFVSLFGTTEQAIKEITEYLVSEYEDAVREGYINDDEVGD
jgi:hypothetical protein